MTNILIKIIPIGLCIYIGLTLIIIVPLYMIQPKEIKNKALVALFIAWIIIGILLDFSGLLGIIMACL